MRRITIMTDELYDLYRNDSDFKEYVDRWCKQRGQSIYEAFRFVLVKEYAKWIKENKK